MFTQHRRLAYLIDDEIVKMASSMNLSRIRIPGLHRIGGPSKNSLNERARKHRNLASSHATMQLPHFNYHRPPDIRRTTHPPQYASTSAHPRPILASA